MLESNLAKPQEVIMKRSGIRRFSWRTRAENPLNIWVFLSVHPAILLAEFSVTTGEDLRSQLVGMAFTWYGLIASLGLLLALRKLLEVTGLLRRGPWVLLILTGSIVGLSADWATSYLQGVPVADILAGFPDRHYFALFLGGLLSVASATLETVRQDYMNTRNIIIGEKVRKATAEVPARSQILQSFVEGAKDRLRSGGTKGEVGKFASELRTFINDELRPLSHTLWEKEEKEQRKFSLRFLTLRVFSQPIRHGWIAAAFGALATLRVTLNRDPETGLVAVLSLFLALWGTFAIQQAFFTQRPLPKSIRPGTLVLTAIVAGAVATAIGPLFPSFDERTVPLNYWLVASIVLLLAGLITTFIAEARKLLADQAKELREVLEAGDLSNEQAKLLASIRARDAANYLHSTTQNRLLALAIRLEAKSQEVSSLSEAELQELDEILDDALEVRRKAGSISEGIKELNQSWHGLIELEVSGFDSVELTEIQEELVFLAIREAVSNSYRHGKATKVAVKIELQGAHLVLSVQDNGLGLKNDPAGLGSKIFDLAGKWKFSEVPGGGTKLKIEL